MINTKSQEKLVPYSFNTTWLKETKYITPDALSREQNRDPNIREGKK